MTLPLSFVGPAAALDGSDIDAAASLLGCEPAVIKAIVDVEARGSGFLPDRRPKILFEAHVFSRLTRGRFDRDRRARGIVSSRWDRSLYGAAGAHQYDRLAQAMALDEDAALGAASWGAFQIMGYHARGLGYPSRRDFALRMTESEGEHLLAFCRFVERNGLAPALAARRWEAFARAFNGPDYRANRYDERLAAAYAFRKFARRAGGLAAAGSPAVPTPQTVQPTEETPPHA